MVNHLTRITLIFLFGLLPIFLSAAPTPDAGKQLFKDNCAQCHAKNMKTPATGPALGGVEERWADYPREDLYAWINNSMGLVATGHPRALEMVDWAPSAMQAFPNLKPEDIESILLYVNGMADGSLLPVKKDDDPGGGSSAVAATPSWTYYAIFAVLGFLALLLARIISNLNVLAAAKEGTVLTQRTLWQTLTSKGVISFALFAAVILGGYTTVNNAINLGRQQGYAPEQPIKFSHETHAGLHKIDCQYCHDGARRSKHAVIPAANTCMNCHKAIKVGSTDGTAELTKIYASVGYNPTDNTYIKDAEKMSQEDYKAIYSKWIADNYLAENELEELDKDGERFVNKQWNNIVSSLTNEQKKSVYGPIEWTRIHNLPDHVYFNHSQHVAVGKLECQNCHGAVEEMATMAQHAPLSMGWCINCHRETEVEFKGNEYYESYEKYHDELASGDKSKVTVEDIGGLECQKCHY